MTTKLLQERLAEDWLHSVLHLCSALFGIYAGWYASNVAPAKVFTGGIGLLYLVLGLYGWFTPGFLLHTPFAIPLGVADNVFHLLLSVPAVVIVVLDIRTFLSDRAIKATLILTQEVSKLSKKIGSWPIGGVGLIAIAIALLAAPAQLEGPVLVPISPGHALSVLDSVALIPLLAGLAVLGGMAAPLSALRHHAHITRKGWSGSVRGGIGSRPLACVGLLYFLVVVGHRRDAVLGDDDHRRLGGRDAKLMSGCKGAE